MAKITLPLQDDVKSAYNYARQGDKEAAFKQGALGLLSNQCVTFNNFDDVYIEDIDLWSDMVNVRKKGMTTKYWVEKRAIRPKL